MFPPRIETERLRLKRFCRENVDVDELYARFSVEAPHVEDVFGVIPDDPFETEKDVIDLVERSEAEWADDEAAVYAVYPKSDEAGGGSLAGYAHLWMMWETRKAELGLLLDKPFWGREYATEVYLELTEVAFDIHGIDLVQIGHPVPNTNSRRSIEKFVDAAGGQFDGVVPNNVRCGDEIYDSRRYSVSKEDFAAAND